MTGLCWSQGVIAEGVVMKIAFSKSISDLLTET